MPLPAIPAQFVRLNLQVTDAKLLYISTAKISQSLPGMLIKWKIRAKNSYRGIAAISFVGTKQVCLILSCHTIIQAICNRVSISDFYKNKPAHSSRFHLSITLLALLYHQSWLINFLTQRAADVLVNSNVQSVDSHDTAIWAVSYYHMPEQVVKATLNWLSDMWYSLHWWSFTAMLQLCLRTRDTKLYFNIDK